MSKHSLNQLFGMSYPADQPSEAGRKRVVDAALAHDQKASRKALRQSALRVAFGTGLGVAAITTVVVLMPKNASAAFMSDLSAAMDEARSVHFVAWRTSADGKRVKARELWHENGKWRVETASRREVLIHDGQKQWTYFPDQATVYTEAKPGGPFAMKHSGWNMSSLIADHQRWGGFGKVEILDKGRNKVAVLTSDREHVRVRVQFDANTNLPSTIEQEALTAKGWQKKSEMQFTFNRPIPQDTFSTVFPKGTAFVDLTAGKEAWQKKFEGEIGRIGQDRPAIVVRDIQVNPEGHVFVLYTSATAWSRNLELTDSLGTSYAVEEHNFQPYVGDAAGNHMRGFLIDGRRLEGRWFIPAEPLAGPWKGRTLKLTYVNVKHVVPPHIRRQIEEGTYPHKEVNLGQMDEVRTVVGSWSIAIAKPTSLLIPPYMRFMGLAPQDEHEVRLSETDARWKYHFRSGDSLKAIEQLKERVRLVEEWEDETGQERILTREYFQIFLLLRSEGRKAEGMPWLKKAMDEPQGGGGKDPNLERVLREEGLK